MKKVLNVASKELYTAVKSKRFITVLLLYSLLLFLLAYSQRDDFLELTTPYVSSMKIDLFGVKGETYMTPLSTLFLLNFTFFTIFGAILGSALGADSINREVESGTIKILLGHPIYRDEVINGKFLGNTLSLAISILVGYILTVSLLLFFGVPVDGESLFRGAIASMIILLYSLIFLSISMLLSTIFKKTETSMLVSVGFAVFMSLIYGIVANMIASKLAGEVIDYMIWREEFEIWNSRLQLLNPAHHCVKLVVLIFSGDRIVNYYSPLSDFILYGINNLALMIVSLLLPFAFAYVRFMTSDLR